jgi:SAM-dependent methyltransferase
MTVVQLSAAPQPIEHFERALHGHPVRVQLEDGTSVALAADMWSRPRVGDDSVVRRCMGPTLDVGCGSGRITEALEKAGLKALGIDISSEAIHLTRRRGSRGLVQDIFARTPALGRWQHVLLLDGNIGIGGDAVALLGRCRELLAARGTVLVEVQAPGSGIQHLLVRLIHGQQSSRPFRWLTSDAHGIKAAAASVGLVLVDEWASRGRWFVELGVNDA